MTYIKPEGSFQFLLRISIDILGLSIDIPQTETDITVSGSKAVFGAVGACKIRDDT